MEKELDFASLQARFEQSQEGSVDPAFGSGGRLFIVVFLSGALLATVCTLLPAAPYALYGALLGVLIEVIGVIGMSVSTLPAVRLLFRSLGRFHSDYADELDRGFDRQRDIIVWLQSFPSEGLRGRLRFVRQAREMLLKKTGLLVGGFEKLGLLPVIVAVYLQLRNWSMPSLRAEMEFEFVVALCLLGLYGIGWAASLWRIRLDVYEGVLQSALDEKS